MPDPHVDRSLEGAAGIDVAFADPHAASDIFMSDLMLETSHRCMNDLQLVVSLLSMQARTTLSEEARQVLLDVARRVGVVAAARSATVLGKNASLGGALADVCRALRALSDPRDILVELEVGGGGDRLTEKQITVIALVASELATNALKHAFPGGDTGRIMIRQEAFQGVDDAGVTVKIEDDGLPFRPGGHATGGLGLALSKRMLVAVGGDLFLPEGDSKVFVLSVPTPN